MSTQSAPPPQVGPATDGSRTFVLYDFTWAEYEQLLAILGERYLRHTFYQGMLELVSPSRKHEWIKSLLGHFLITICRVLQIPRQSIGSTTMHREDWDGGLEPDQGYYLGEESLGQIADRDAFDPEADPPPDLIIEVDISASSTARMELYRSMGVPEIWRYRKDEVHIFKLGRDGRYRQVQKSPRFSFLKAKDLNRFLAMREKTNDTDLELAFEAWVREQTQGGKS